MTPAPLLARMLQVACLLLGAVERLEGDDAARQAFLGAVADRRVVAGRLSDVAVLERLVAWDVFILRRLSPAERWDRLTGDLVRVCTERDLDARSIARDSPYRVGRFRDRGFAASFRDGGDQVRHFCWALRVATVYPPGVSNLILAGKEMTDARTDGARVNAADLALNRAALALVRDVRRETRARAPEGTRAWSRRFHEVLTTLRPPGRRP